MLKQTYGEKMKSITYILLSMVLCFAGCKSPSSNQKTDNISIKETDPARQYLNEYKASKTVPSLGTFGWKEVDEYWAKVPELQALRDDFEKADDILKNELMKEDEFRVAYYDFMSDTSKSVEEHKATREVYNQAKRNVYPRLMKNQDFRLIKENRDNSLFISNIRTLEYIISDYEKRGKEFPVDWMEKDLSGSRGCAPSVTVTVE